MKNEEVQNIAKILGLTFGKDYADTSSLRYGHLMIMAGNNYRLIVCMCSKCIFYVYVYTILYYFCHKLLI